MSTVKQLDKPLDKHTKEELTDLLTSLDLEPHSKKLVMVNRLRYAIGEGQLTSLFDETSFDPEIEAKHQPKPKKEKAAKAPKAPKTEPVYNWVRSNHAGRRVWVFSKTCVILKESEDGGHFLVALPDGTEKAAKETSCRFKAVDDRYRDKYHRDELARTESGGVSVHSGSLVARALLGATAALVGSVYAENGLQELYETKVKAERNKGMIRMDLGNILMARVRKGEAVTIFGLDDLEQAAKIGDERGALEAEATKLRKAQMAQERSEKAAQAKEAKLAEKAAKAAQRAIADEQKVKVEAKARKPKAPKTPKAEVTKTRARKAA